MNTWPFDCQLCVAESFGRTKNRIMLPHLKSRKPTVASRFCWHVVKHGVESGVYFGEEYGVTLGVNFGVLFFF